MSESWNKWADELVEWCDKWGLGFSAETDHDYVISGLTAWDGEEAEWIRIDALEDTVQATDTDKNNMWLYESRPDLGPDALLEMASEFARIIEWSDMRLSDIIDPEDWQEIADVDDAYADPRFFEAVLG